MGFSKQEYWSGVPLPSPTNYVRTVKYTPIPFSCVHCEAGAPFCLFFDSVNMTNSFIKMKNENLASPPLFAPHCVYVMAVLNFRIKERDGP